MEKQYLDLLHKVFYLGDDVPNRTGIDTRSTFGEQMRFDLSRGFPLITTKFVPFKIMVGELLWFIEGSGNEYRLREITFKDRIKPTIWTANANADYWTPKAKFQGDLGRIYGVQWRNWRGKETLNYVDQFQNLIDGLKNDPHSRRHIVTAWNPGEIDQMALPPCHTFFQCYVSADNRLSLQLYQRSADMFLGVPFNIAEYALLTHMLAKECGYQVGDFVHTIGDAHIYHNHFDAVKEQLSRSPYSAPKLVLDDVKDIYSYTVDDIKVENYKYHPKIQAEMAI